MRKELLSLRQKLDDEITYGTVENAINLAFKGLNISEVNSFLCEKEYFKGQVEFLNGNFTKAIKCFDKAISHDSCDGASYNDRALCMVELGVIDEAFYYFNKGIEVEPDFDTIYHNKGWLLNKVGLHLEAIKCFKKTLILNPARAVTYENLADAYKNIKKNKEAYNCYIKALDCLDLNCESIREQLIEQINSLKLKL